MKETGPVDSREACRSPQGEEGGAELVLGQIARSQGHYDEARTFFTASLSTYEGIGDRQQIRLVTCEDARGRGLR